MTRGGMLRYAVTALVCGILASTAVAQNVLTCGKADILLILDASGSVQVNFDQERQFAARLASRFTIGPNAVQFAALTFSTTYVNNFGFTAYQNTISLQAAIRNLPYLGQATSTGAALQSARVFSFTPANGARPNIAKIAVIITDGNSQNGTNTAMEAYLLKQSGVTIFAIGVGSRIGQDELNALATSPDHAFNVSSFSTLESIRDEIERDICEQIGSDPLTPYGSCISTSCLGRVDGNYPACDPECRYGYYYSCVNEFAYRMPCALGWYTDSNGNKYLARMVYNPSTDTCEYDSLSCPRDATRYKEEQDPNGGSYVGGPPAAPRPCLSEQDTCNGRPDGNYAKCYPGCQDGFYYSCSNNETVSMPCPNGFYTIGNTRVLARWVFDQTSGTCKASASYCPRDPEKYPSTGPGSSGQTGSDDGSQTETCDGEADILLILDSSGSIGRFNFEIQKRFVADIIENFNVGPDAFQFSALDFSSNVENLFGFKQYRRNEDIREAILDAPYLGKGTNTARALTLAKIYSFTVFNGARPNVSKYAIVVTDGVSQDPARTAEEAQKLKNSGVMVIAIGVGSSVRESELNAIASLPSYVFMIKDFNALNRLRSLLVRQLCEKITQNTQCIQDSCGGRPDGIYPACDCRSGYYYSCVSEFAYKMPCAKGRYTDEDGNEFYARRVYNPATETCVADSPSCPRNHYNYKLPPPAPYTGPSGEVIPRSCMGAYDSCYGKEDGNYPMCYPDCQSGRYISCSNQEKYVMPCALGWYTDANNNRFTARMVFDPNTNTCELKADYCPRDPRDAGDEIIDVEPRPCPALVDIIFVMDSSGSIGMSNYTLQLDFLIDLATKFKIGPNDARFGAVVFSSDVQELFKLKDHSDHVSLAAAIRSAIYYGGSTNTHRALDKVRYQDLFSTANGGRENARDIIILLTDGLSNRPSKTLKAAKKLKDAGVEILTVGIADSDDEELRAVASQDNYFFKAADFRALTTIEAELTKRTCEVVPKCRGRADILFILDSSGSINENNFEVEKSFVASLVQPFVVGPDDIQFAAFTFDDDVTKLFNFDTYSTNSGVMQAILGAAYPGGGTNTSEALIEARNLFASSASGRRNNAGKLVIIVTDGQSNNPSETALEAALLKAQGVSVIAIGVGNARQVELQAIASSPSQVFMVNSFEVLEAIRSGVVTTACQSELIRTSCIDFTCKGRPDGNYPACDPECKEGYYYTCNNEYKYRMPCSLGHYKHPYSDDVNFQAPYVFNPDTNTCEKAAGYCPRNPVNYINRP